MVNGGCFTILDKSARGKAVCSSLACAWRCQTYSLSFLQYSEGHVNAGAPRKLWEYMMNDELFIKQSVLCKYFYQPLAFRRLIH